MLAVSSPQVRDFSLACLRWLLLAGLLSTASWRVGALETNAISETILPGPPPGPSGGSMFFDGVGVANFVSLVEETNAPGGTDPLAPGVAGGFDAINYDTDGALTGFNHIPPDPCGAAGSNHLVNVVNCSIQWFTKAGTLQNSQRLGKNGSTHVGSFFESLTPVNNLFDPKVIYDQHAGRFLVVALEKVSSPAASRLLLAVSDDGDPNGTWYFAAFDGKILISGSDCWADYPGFAVDEEAVYLTMNMFRFSDNSNMGARLWIINKTPLFTGGAASFTLHDPYFAVSSGNGGTLQPAHVFGSGGVPSAAGTFLISGGWTSGANDLFQIIRVDAPLTAPAFSAQFINLGDIHNTTGTFDAPQPGTATLINANDSRPLQAIWRSNNLYVVNTVKPPSGTDAGQATAHWVRVNTATLGSLSLADQGNVGGEELASGTYTFFPSIAVDFRGNIGIGFAASAPTLYAGSFYTGRLTTDTAGTMQPPGTNALGVDYYIRTFGVGRNRWGDYSGMSLDPATESTFWVYNEFAMTRGTPSSGEDGRWSTRWGSFTFNNRPAFNDLGLGTLKNHAVTFVTTRLATDPDGDSLSFSASATSTQGGTVSVSGGNLTYVPLMGFSGSDTFTVTTDDGRGGTTNRTVSVTVNSGAAVSLNVVFGPMIQDGDFVVRFAGIPGRTYTIQWSADGSVWAKKSNLTAPTTNTGFGVGVFEFRETTGGAISRFYRTVYPSY